MRQALLSNASLGLGSIMLAGFAVMEMNGLHTNPLVPATAALLIGFTAVLDRVQIRLFR